MSRRTATSDTAPSGVPHWLLLLVIFLNFAVPGCRHGRDSSDELLIASPHRDEIKEEMERGFRAAYAREMGRDIRVVWLDLGGSSNIQKYISDRLASGPDAGIDVFFGGGSDPFDALKRQGSLVPYKLPDATLSQLPADLHGVPLYDPDHCWYGAVLSTFGIMFNHEVLRRTGLPAPATWADLGSETYSRGGAGWIGASDPRFSGSVHMIFENILQAHGWDDGYAILARMAANAPRFQRESAEVPRQVQIGEVAAAPVIEFYAFSLMAREGRDRIGFVLPEGLTVIGPDAIAIVRGAPHQPAAESFLRFVLSEEGQKLWLLRRGAPGGPTHYDLGRLAMLPHLYDAAPDQLAVSLNPFRGATPLKYDGRTASRRWNVLNDFVGATLIDAHAELRHAWIAACAAPGHSQLLDELTQPPLSASELLELAEPMRQSTRLRNETLSKWLADARARYRAVATKARQLAVVKREPAAIPTSP